MAELLVVYLGLASVDEFKKHVILPANMAHLYDLIFEHGCIQEGDEKRWVMVPRAKRTGDRTSMTEAEMDRIAHEHGVGQ